MRNATKTRFICLACWALPAALSTGCAGLKPVKIIDKQHVAQAWDRQRALLKYELSNAELRNGRVDNARGLAQEAVQLNPDAPANHELLAKTYIANGDFRAAEQILAALVVKHPEAAGGWYLLGTLHEREQGAGLAISDFQRAVEAAPDRLEYRLALCEAQADAGDLRAAMAILDADAERFRSDPTFHIAKAELRRRGGEMQQAVEAYRMALRLGSTDADARKNLGLCLNWLGQHAEAVTNLEPVLESADHPGAAETCAYLSSLLATQQYRKAVAWLARAGIEWPQSGQFEVLRAQALAGTEDFRAALRAAQRASQLDPDLIDAYLLSAGLHARLGQERAALETLERALRASPDSTAGWELYSQLLERFGDAASAGAARERLAALQGTSKL